MAAIIFPDVINATRLNQIVDNVNAHKMPELFAAHYAVDAAIQQAGGLAFKHVQKLNRESFLIHLQILDFSGAYFDIDAALEHCFALRGRLLVSTARKLLHCTQQGLGELLGYTGRHIHNIERGYTPLNKRVELALVQLVQVKNKV